MMEKYESNLLDDAKTSEKNQDYDALIHFLAKWVMQQMPNKSIDKDFIEE